MSPPSTPLSMGSLHRPTPQPLQPPPLPPGGSDNDDDIYRGSRPPSLLTVATSLDSASISTSSSSSSSSVSFIGGGRLGAIAAGVERAISRWAKKKRRNSSTSSLSSGSSSSSSSSAPSVVTLTRSQLARRRNRRRRLSNADLRSVTSDIDILERISQIKAREELRIIPREFALYMPTARPVKRQDTTHGPKRVFKTTSLPLIIRQLDAVLKKSLKAQRKQYRGHYPLKGKEKPLDRSDFNYYISPEKPKTSSADFSVPSAKKIKNKPKARGQLVSPVNHFQSSLRTTPNAWWLDVASPTWDDIRTIGKLLHLHPLTLEDILQQEPREKLELFPKLGYYFVVFRAIESQATQDKIQRMDVHNGQEGGVVGEAIVYLIVFNEGVCTFHFTDISEHTGRVTNRLLLLENVANMTSDWIAHGILDSIVDSFFPVVEGVEKQVQEIEDVVFSTLDSIAVGPTTEPQTPKITKCVNHPAREDKGIDLDEKATRPQSVFRGSSGHHIQFSVPQTPSLVLRRLRRLFKSKWRPLGADDPVIITASPLQRMAKTRKMVTTLTRLLASKSEVVSQVKKRLLNVESGARSGGTDKWSTEVAMYMGDIQDHILTLQHSLAHYERMLSQSHPIYLAQLRTTVAMTKARTDRALIYLTIVSIGVLSLQTLIGIFSVNITVPSNKHNLRSPYTIFGNVIAAAALELLAYLFLVRQWWVRAKRKRVAVF